MKEAGKITERSDVLRKKGLSSVNILARVSTSPATVQARLDASLLEK